MVESNKKKFVKPELTKYEKPLDEVTLCNSGSGPSCSNDCTKIFSWFGRFW